MSKKKSGWPELGIIVKNKVYERDEDGKIKKDSEGNYIQATDKNGKALTRLSFKLNEDIDVYRDGKKIDLNDKRTGLMITPMQQVEGLYKAGHIDDSDIESKRESAKENYTWLRYKIQLPPPRD